LLDTRDHPTAQDVFIRVKEQMPSISLATVYNCLEALVGHELVKQVNFDRAPSRYCPNLEEHVHFQDERTGQIFDVVFKKDKCLTDILELPNGVKVNKLELTLKGIMPGLEIKK